MMMSMAGSGRRNRAHNGMTSEQRPLWMEALSLTNPSPSSHSEFPFETTNPDSGIPLSRPSSRKGYSPNRRNRDSGSIVLGHSHDEGKHRLMPLPQLAKLKNSRGRERVNSANGSFEHCQEGSRLPLIGHTPKLQDGKPEDLRKSKNRSKQLKQKVLGSSEANLLPNRPELRYRPPIISKKSSKTKSKASPEKKSTSSCPPLPLLQDKIAEQKKPPPPPPVPPGQVNVLPKIDTAVLTKIKSQPTKSPPKHESSKSTFQSPRTPFPPPSSTSTASSPKRQLHPHIYSKVESHDGVSSFHGGPMILESRSLHKLILKPEVPPELQVVRRKTKFMENQRLRDIYSLCGGGPNTRKTNPNPNHHYHENLMPIGGTPRSRGSSGIDMIKGGSPPPYPNHQQHHHHHRRSQFSNGNSNSQTRLPYGGAYPDVNNNNSPYLY